MTDKLLLPSLLYPSKYDQNFTKQFLPTKLFVSYSFGNVKTFKILEKVLWLDILRALCQSLSHFKKNFSFMKLFENRYLPRTPSSNLTAGFDQQT